MPPTPSGLSRLWLGPAAKPSSEMDMWQVVKVMASQTDTSRETHRCDPLQRALRRERDGAETAFRRRASESHPMPRVLPILLMLVLAAPAAASTTIPVTTTADVIANDGQCSLREAVISSNTDVANPTDCVDGGPTDDYLTLGAGTYTLAIGGAGEDA